VEHFGFRSSSYDFTLLLIYVNDVIITMITLMVFHTTIKLFLIQDFEIKGLAKLSYLLGLYVFCWDLLSRQEGYFDASQAEYPVEYLRQSSIERCHLGSSASGAI